MQDTTTDKIREILTTSQSTTNDEQVNPDIIKHEHFKRVCPDHGDKLIKLVSDPRSNWLCRVINCDYEYPLRVPIASKESNVKFRAENKTGNITTGVITRQQFNDMALRCDIFIEEVR